MLGRGTEGKIITAYSVLKFKCYFLAVKYISAILFYLVVKFIHSYCRCLNSLVGRV